MFQWRCAARRIWMVRWAKFEQFPSHQKVTHISFKNAVHQTRTSFHSEAAVKSMPRCMSFLFFSYTEWIQISLLLNGPSTNHWVRPMTIVAFKMRYKFEVYIIPASMLGWVNSHKVLQLDLSTWPLRSGSFRTQPRQPHMMRSSFKNGRWNLGDEIAGKRINHWIWATVAYLWISLDKATLERRLHFNLGWPMMAFLKISRVFKPNCHRGHRGCKVQVQ
jgi:hypothetical protein